MLIIILFIGYLIITIDGISPDMIEKDFNSSIEQILLINENLFVGTVNSLHRLSSLTLDKNLPSLNLTPPVANQSYHWKVLLSIRNENLFSCGTIQSGSCQIIDENFNLIINSSLAIVANDPINSTIALIIPEENLIYIGVTYTNQGISRWQIPNLSGRSLNLTENFLKIFSMNNDDESIFRDDLSLRFMPRQQTTFIVQYIHSFYTTNYIYFLTNQPHDIDQTIIISKIIRFCRKNKSYSIIRSYTELPLICLHSDWILQSAQTMIDQKNELILIGLFRKRDGSNGTNICSWKMENQIDKSFLQNYHHCYSMGIGQRGLTFIKPNEPCRKDQNWSIGMADDLCSSIISERLPYPVGGINPILGHLFYENSLENTRTFHLHSYGSTILLSQGLINGTFKLGILQFSFDINWIYSSQLSTNLSISSLNTFDNRTASLFIASGSKIFRLSFSIDCTSRLSCDECSNNVFCGWCSTNERCTLENDCPGNSWKQENHQCTHMSNVQPMNASIDHSQWINFTFSKLSQLEQNEIYQCIFEYQSISASTQAIKLDSHRISCSTPLNYFPIQIGNQSKVRLSLRKFPSNLTLAIVREFTFYNCSWYVSCQSCRSIRICQWCSDRCASICMEKSSEQCLSFELVDPSNILIPLDQTIEIPLKFSNTIGLSLECRLNDTIVGFIDRNQICRISKIPELIIDENNRTIYLSIYENHISIGIPMKMYFYRCDLVDNCEQCQSYRTCSWCQGTCLSKKINSCFTNSRCTSWKIEDFYPKIVPINGETIVKISFNELINENIIEITLADIPCLIITRTNPIECQTRRSNSSRQGPIRISFENSIILLSKELIEYRQSSIISFNPLIAYEFGGEILQISGHYLSIGNSQEIFIGNIQCIQIKQTVSNGLTCRLPSISSGFYNISVMIDKQTILNHEMIFKVTPNPIVQDIHPLVSFASGGRLITIRGMYFESAQSIIVEFSYRKWNTKLKIDSNDIISLDNGMISSFHFRSPGITFPSTEYPSPPIDLNFSIYFDNLIVLSNLIQFHYLADVLLNISSIPPTLSYTGEELKLQIENLTVAASLEDIQLFIGCTECQLKSFTSKGITCQPPNQLLTNISQHQIDCNSSMGSIRFRIGFREYLIGYLSYTRSSSSSRYSLGTIIFLSFCSCLVTIALLTFVLCLYMKLKKSSKEKSSSLSPIEEQVFWSTTTSAAAGPYYQVYEQISSHENTLTRAPLIVCPYHYREDYSTLLLKQPLRMNIPSFKILSIEHQSLKKLLLPSNIQSNRSNIRQSMELFYDLLLMSPFSQSFIDQIILNNCPDIFQCYSYIFRYYPLHLNSFPLTRQISFLKFISTLFVQSKRNLNEFFHLFDHLIDHLIHFIDHSPCDQLLNRSMNSLSSSTLLILSNFPYDSFELSINYENLLHFHLPVFDCDSIEQIQEKIIHHLNSSEDIELVLPSKNHCSLCSHQMPRMKEYQIDSSILCRKKSAGKKSRVKKEYIYHLAMENQLMKEEKLIEEKLKENKKYFEEFLKNFYENILQGFEIFHYWKEQMDISNEHDLFQFYIQVISDLLRRMNVLMISRSTCPIIQSCLNVIADGLEFTFQTKTEIKKEIEFLFENERKYFQSFQPNSLQIPSCSILNSLSLDSRSLILEDDIAIQCLFQLYQFYELHSESINQHIGENHVSVLLPVHHLLVQIRQLIHSDTITTVI